MATKSKPETKPTQKADWAKPNWDSDLDSAQIQQIERCLTLTRGDLCCTTTNLSFLSSNTETKFPFAWIVGVLSFCLSTHTSCKGNKEHNRTLMNCTRREKKNSETQHHLLSTARFHFAHDSNHAQSQKSFMPPRTNRQLVELTELAEISGSPCTNNSSETAQDSSTRQYLPQRWSGRSVLLCLSRRTDRCRWQEENCRHGRIRRVSYEGCGSPDRLPTVPRYRRTRTAEKDGELQNSSSQQLTTANFWLGWFIFGSGWPDTNPLFQSFFT